MLGGEERGGSGEREEFKDEGVVMRGGGFEEGESHIPTPQSFFISKNHFFYTSDSAPQHQFKLQP